MILRREVLLLLGALLLPGGRAALAAPGAVEGVAALRGELVPGVVVLAFSEPGPGPGARPRATSAPTDREGRYRLELEPGSYSLLAVKSSGAPWPFRGEPGDLFCYYLGNPVLVERRKTTRVGFNMVAVRDRPAPISGEGGGVAGRVLFEGRPLGRAYVHVYADATGGFRGLGVATQPAAEDGTFRVRLAPGRYYLIARKRRAGGMYGPPGRDDYVGYFPGNPVDVRAGVFTTVALETTTRVDQLEDPEEARAGSAGWFAGTVTAAGAPVAGVYVLFYRSREFSGVPAFVAGPTDAAGTFKVRAAAGEFYLQARSNLGGPLEEGEWFGKAELRAGGAPAGGIRLTVERFRGK